MRVAAFSVCSGKCADMGRGAFSDCPILNAELKENGIIYWNNRVIGADSKLKAAKVRDGAVAIGPGAFASCDELISVELPKSIAIIGEEAFSYCTQLVSIELPAGLAEK